MNLLFLRRVNDNTTCMYAACATRNALITLYHRVILHESIASRRRARGNSISFDGGFLSVAVRARGACHRADFEKEQTALLGDLAIHRTHVWPLLLDGATLGPG